MPRRVSGQQTTISFHHRHHRDETRIYISHRRDRLSMQPSAAFRSARPLSFTSARLDADAAPPLFRPPTLLGCARQSGATAAAAIALLLFFFPPPFLSLSPARILDDSEMIRAYGVSALVMVVEHLSCRPRSIDRITKRGLPFAPARTQASTWIPRLATESSSSSSPMPFYLAGSQPRSIYIHAFPSRAWMFRMMPLQFWVWLSPSTLDSITSEYTSQGSECWSHSL